MVQVAALKEGRIKKPVVAWVSGTCAKLFKSEVQFGHAGAKSGGQMESAQACCTLATLSTCVQRNCQLIVGELPHGCELLGARCHYTDRSE